MVSIAVALTQATACLQSSSDTPRLDAEVLLAHVSGYSRTYFRAWPEKQLDTAVALAFETVLQHRLQGQPVAYLTGWREFWSRDFQVSPAVLIPRPDTELLVELALQHLPLDRSVRVLDLGTGSGAVAVTLALERPLARVTAVDCSRAALALAAANAARLGAGAVDFVESDWFAALPAAATFDLLVSNPPYIAAADPHLTQGDVRFEPLTALAAGADGLAALRVIVAQAAQRLTPGGWLLFEHGWEQAAAARGLLQAAGFRQVGSFRDLAGHERVSGGCYGIAPPALQQAYLAACEAELQAFKPGNVSIHSEGHDMTVADFRRSALASAPYLCDPALSLGERIFQAVRATRTAVGCNTNLGIILLAAPLLQACLHPVPGLGLRGTLQKLLANTSRADADWVYQAIRLAAPGGLGASAEQDVYSPPAVTLLQAMRIAEGRDHIAWQYTNSYQTVFDLAIPRYHNRMSLWDDEAWATVAVFAGLLKTVPDSHIERKFGSRFTRMVADKMMQVDQFLSASDRPWECLPLLREVDSELKSAGINPGTTADLTVACLLAARLEKLLEG